MPEVDAAEVEWDETKRQLNFEKHGIDFEDAARIWSGTVADQQSDRPSEQRWITTGRIEGRIIAVVWTCAAVGGVWCLQGWRGDMNEKITRRKLSELRPGKTDWDYIDRLTDEEIQAAIDSDPDAAPALDHAGFEGATVVLPEPKQAVSLRLDTDVLRWFREQGPGYQSRMNAVLRQYAQAHGATVFGRSARAPRKPRKSSAA